MDFLKCQVLEDLLPTGFPFGYLILIRGDLGMGKTLLVKLLARSVLSYYPLVYVSFDDNPESVVNDLKDFSNRLFIIDGFSLSDQRRVKASNVIDMITELDPGQLISKVTQAVYSRGARGLIIDSINDLLINIDPRGGLITMLKQIKSLSRLYNMVTFIVAHVTTEDIDNLLNSIEYVFDGVIEMEFDENMANLGIPVRRLRIKRMKGVSHSMNWYYFTTAKGTIVPVDINEIKNMLKNTLESLGIQVQGGQ